MFKRPAIKWHVFCMEIPSLCRTVRCVLAQKCHQGMPRWETNGSINYSSWSYFFYQHFVDLQINRVLVTGLGLFDSSLCHGAKKTPRDVEKEHGILLVAENQLA